MEKLDNDEKMHAEDSAPIDNSRTPEDVINQTTNSVNNRFPWTTIVIVLILILIVASLVILVKA